MSITQEMQELLKEIQYKKNGKFDTAIYRICSKFYRREKLKEEERIYIMTTLNGKRKISLLKFIDICDP